MTALIRRKEDEAEVTQGMYLTTIHGWPIQVHCVCGPSHKHPGGCVIGYDQIAYSPSEIGCYATMEG